MTDDAFGLLDRIRRFAMPDGDVAAREVTLVQEGEMRLAPDAPWRPFRAEQRMAGDGLDFRWRAWVRMAPFAPVRVVDAFEDGSGFLRASLFGVVPVARGRGADLDRGEVQRALAELPWRPFAFGRLAHMTFAATDARRLRGTYDDGRVRAEVDWEVDDSGRVTGASAVRPRLVGSASVETPWRGTFGDWRRFGPIQAPAYAEVAWNLPEGPFVYWRGRVVALSVR